MLTCRLWTGSWKITMPKHRYFRAKSVEYKNSRLTFRGEMAELPGPLDVCVNDGFDQGEFGCTLEDGTEITVYVRPPDAACLST